MELKLYSWGANSHGQLGIGCQDEMRIKPQQVPAGSLKSLNNIMKMAGGGGHILFLDKDNKLHTAGWNERGQLGTFNPEDSNFITSLPSSRMVFVDVACGWDSSAAIDQYANLHVWGSNSFNQLGVSNLIASSSYTMTSVLLMPKSEKVKQVAFGLRFMCVLCVNGIVYVIGLWKDTDNFDVITCNGAKFYKLKQIDDGTITQIACGAKHIICMKSSGAVIGYGDNKFNQCNSPIIENNESIKYIRCGWDTNGILTHEGSIYLWGRNTYGQLADRNVESNDVRKLNGINDEIKEFHLGSQHGMVVTENGSVYTWGWNEHGNCGHQNVEENLFEPYKVDLPGKCIMGMAGAGFCFALVDCGQNTN